MENKQIEIKPKLLCFKPMFPAIVFFFFFKMASNLRPWVCGLKLDLPKATTTIESSSVVSQFFNYLTVSCVMCPFMLSIVSEKEINTNLVTVSTFMSTTLNETDPKKGTLATSFATYTFSCVLERGGARPDDVQMPFVMPG